MSGDKGGSKLVKPPRYERGTMVGLASATYRAPTIDVQIEALKKAGCLTIYTPDDDPGAVIEACYITSRGGKATLVVWSLDRLATSIAGVLEVVGTLRLHKVGLWSLSDDVESRWHDGGAIDRCFEALAGAVSAYREEWQHDGREAARRKGTHVGRPRKLDNEAMESIRELRKTMSAKQISEHLDVGLPTIYRAIRLLGM